MAGHLTAVGEQQCGLVAAETFDGELAEAALVERDFAIGDGHVAVLAGALEPDRRPRAVWQRFDGFDDVAAAAAQGDEADVLFVELGQLGVGGERGVEHQQSWLLAGGGLPELAEADDLV